MSPWGTWNSPNRRNGKQNGGCQRQGKREMGVTVDGQKASVWEAETPPPSGRRMAVVAAHSVSVCNATELCAQNSHSGKSYVCFTTIKKNQSSPGWCGLVDWTLACEPKDHWFYSQSGHMPGLWARYAVGDAREATTHWCFSPFPSLYK